MDTTSTDPAKKKKSLAEVAAHAEQLFEQMDAANDGVDPLAVVAPRAGELRETPAPSSEQPPPDAPAAPVITTPAPAVQPVDEWAEYDEIPYEDADTGETYVVRAPKKYSGKVKDGYARRSVMDRNARYLSAARPVLEPLVASGEFYRIQPLLEQALNDPEYAQAIGELYRRRLSGEPLTQTQERQLDKGLQQVEQHVAQPVEFPDEEAFNDPYVRAIGQYVDKAIQERLQPFQQELSKTREYETQRVQSEQQQRVAAAEARRVQGELLSEMRALYPGDFSGDEAHDNQRLSQLFQYAVNSRYITDYNPNTVKLGVRLAYRELAASTSSPSPAATALSAAQVEADARARASQMVASTTGGASVVAQAPALTESQRLAQIKSRKKDGSMKKPLEIAAEVARAIERG